MGSYDIGHDYVALYQSRDKTDTNYQGGSKALEQ